MIAIIELLLLLLAVAPARGQHVDNRFDVERYIFRLEVFDSTDSIEGHTTVEVVLRATGVESVYLDLVGRGLSGKGMTVRSVAVDGQPATFTHENDRLLVDLDGTASAGDRLSLDSPRRAHR